MPILDIELVCASDRQFASVSAQAIADALGAVLGAPHGRTWIRLRKLDATAYAENHATLDLERLPVFVTVLHAHPPEKERLAAEVAALTAAVAREVGRPADRVHVQYAPPAAGRQAFGGKLVE